MSESERPETRPRRTRGTTRSARRSRRSSSTSRSRCAGRSASSIRLALLSLFALIVLLVVSVALYLSNRTQWVAQEMALVINQALARHSDIVLSLRDIHGNPLAGFCGRVARACGSATAALPPLLEARQLRVAYSLWGLVDRVAALDRRRDRSPGGAPVADRAGQPAAAALGVAAGAVAARSRSASTCGCMRPRWCCPTPTLSAHQVDFDAVGLSRPARVDIAQSVLDARALRHAPRRAQGACRVRRQHSVRVSELRSPELRLSASAIVARERWTAPRDRERRGGALAAAGTRVRQPDAQRAGFGQRSARGVRRYAMARHVWTPRWTGTICRAAAAVTSASPAGSWRSSRCASIRRPDSCAAGCSGRTVAGSSRARWRTATPSAGRRFT